MAFRAESLEKLKQIHLNETGIVLSDSEVLELAHRLLSLGRIILKPIPKDTISPIAELSEK